MRWPVDDFGDLPEQEQGPATSWMLCRAKVFNLGDHGDKYYIILTGAVSVQTLAENEQEGGSMEVVAQLQEGHGFGEPLGSFLSFPLLCNASGWRCRIPRCARPPW